MKKRNISGSGELHIEIGILDANGEFVNEGQLYDLHNECNLPESLNGLKTLLQSLPEETWAELNIKFDVNGYFDPGDYMNPPYSEDNRTIKEITIGYTEDGKYIEKLVPDENNLYDTLFDYYENQINDREFNEHGYDG